MLINQTEFNKLFACGNMAVTDEQYTALEKYSRLLVLWNEKINLTAITDPEGIALKHFFDSVYPFTLIDIPDNASVIDVGTGAGFPSCPLKIFRRDIKLTLLDSLNKRIKFLQEVSDTLGLDAKCIHARAEDLGKDAAYREKYDIATARAVSAMPELSEYCLPFVKKGGIFCAMKGPSEDISTAGNALKLLGGKLEKDEHYEINGEQRRVVIVKKAAVCPPKYPRASGKIKSKPL